MIKDEDVRWTRSRYCIGANSTCVEVAMEVEHVGVRDGKAKAGPVLHFSMDEWRVFVHGIRAGDFNV